MTSCSKCGEPAQVAMSFAYAVKALWLRDLDPEFDRYVDYALCEMHADRMRPPNGWAVNDQRGLEPPLFLATDVA